MENPGILIGSSHDVGLRDLGFCSTRVHRKTMSQRTSPLDALTQPTLLCRVAMVLLRCRLAAAWLAGEPRREIGRRARAATCVDTKGLKKTANTGIEARNRPSPC